VAANDSSHETEISRDRFVNATEKNMFVRPILFRSVLVGLTLVLGACKTNRVYDESMALPTDADVGTVSYTFSEKPNDVTRQATIGREIR
jgi:hypothetical protein